MSYSSGKSESFFLLSLSILFFFKGKNELIEQFGYFRVHKKYPVSDEEHFNANVLVFKI